MTTAVQATNTNLDFISLRNVQVGILLGGSKLINRSTAIEQGPTSTSIPARTSRSEETTMVRLWNTSNPGILGELARPGPAHQLTYRGWSCLHV